VEEATRAAKVAEGALENLRRKQDEAGRLAQASLKQAELKAATLQDELDQAKRAADLTAQTLQAELKRAQGAHRKTEEMLGRMENRLEEMTRRQEADQATIADLRARLESAMPVESIRSPEREPAAEVKETIAGDDSLIEPPWDTTTPDQVDEQPPVDFLPVAATPPALPETPPTVELATSAAPATAATAPTEPIGESPEAPLEPKTPKTPRRKKPAASAQIDLWESLSTAVPGPEEADEDQTPIAAPAEPVAAAALPGPDEEEELGDQPGEPEHAEVVAELPRAADPDLKPAVASKPKPHGAAAHGPTVNVTELRAILHQILPLLVDQDPGAKECFKDNRAFFRSAFTPDGYAEFEQSVKSGEFVLAVEQLRRVARKHGISV
jgi:hypothetical protein